MARAWSTISSKVMVDPPPLWCLCQGSIEAVKVESLREAHREYSRNQQGWPEKLPRAAGPLAWGTREVAGNVQNKGHVLSPAGTSTHDLLNKDAWKTDIRLERAERMDQPQSIPVPRSDTAAVGAPCRGRGGGL